MELDKFVESTLIQIAKGVAGAQSQVAALGGNVNPEKASSLGAAHAARQN
ncbi:hypothetical protein AB5A11_003558, partial [Vibrio cholerae]